MSHEGFTASLPRDNVNKTSLKRLTLGVIVLTVAIPGGLVYSQYQRNMSLAYQRISSDGKIIETTYGPIEYTEFGEGAPMLIVHGAGGGYDQGEYFAKLTRRSAEHTHTHPGNHVSYIFPHGSGGAPAPACARTVVPVAHRGRCRSLHRVADDMALWLGYFPPSRRYRAAVGSVRSTCHRSQPPRAGDRSLMPEMLGSSAWSSALIIGWSTATLPFQL